MPVASAATDDHWKGNSTSFQTQGWGSQAPKLLAFSPSRPHEALSVPALPGKARARIPLRLFPFQVLLGKLLTPSASSLLSCKNLVRKTETDPDWSLCIPAILIPT